MLKSSFQIGLTLICLTLLTFSINAQVTKKVIVEEVTGTWCGLCPAGFMYVDSIKQHFDNSIVVALHQDDPFSEPSGTAVGEEYTGGGVPGFLIDRNLFDTYQFITFGLEYDKVMEHVGYRAESSTPVSVSLTHAELDSETNEYEVRVQCHFYEGIQDRELRFNLWLVEEQVEPSQQDVGQVNFFNFEEDHPYFNVGNPIPDFTHSDVLRVALGGAWGIEASIPSTTIESGTGFQYIFHFPVSDEWDLDQLKLVAVVQEANEDRNKRSILNAEDILLESLLELSETNEEIDTDRGEDVFVETPIGTGLNEATSAPSIVTVYPNPSRDWLRVEFYQPLNNFMRIGLYSLDGKLVKELRNEPFVRGAHSLECSTTDLLSGTYLLKIEGTGGTALKQIQVR